MREGELVRLDYGEERVGIREMEEEGKDVGEGTGKGVMRRGEKRWCLHC